MAQTRTPTNIPTPKYWCPQYQDWLSLEEQAYIKLTEAPCDDAKTPD